jgi:hypothetical protein
MYNIIINLLLLILILIFCCLFLFRNLETNKIITGIIYPLKTIKYEIFINNYPIIYNKIPIFIFFHICPYSEDNITHINILNEQINKLISSGLYDKCDKLYYGCSCKNCDIILNDYFKKFDKVYKLEDSICPNINSYENTTINGMIKFAKNSKIKFYGLYIHTKGTTTFSQAQNYWRHFLMYWLVQKHDICIDILNRDFYTVGVNYLEDHYSGNFFWFSSDYLKNSDYIYELYNRYNAEFFLFKKFIKNKHICLATNNRFMSDKKYITGLYYSNFYFNDYIIDSNKDIILSII